MARPSQRFAALVAGGMLLLLLAAPPVLAATAAVQIAGFSFSPGSLTIHVGDTVTWSNSDPRTHTATADDGSWDTGSVGSGASVSLTFTTAGTFTYHCQVHPGMTATLVVQAAAPPATDTAPAPAAGGSPPSWPALGLAFLFGLAIAGRRLARRASTEEDRAG